MKTQLEVIVPKGHTLRVLRGIERKLTEMKVPLIPYHRGAVDFPDSHDTLIYCEVPREFIGTQEVSNALYATHTISTDNSVRKKNYATPK